MPKRGGRGNNGGGGGLGVGSSRFSALADHDEHDDRDRNTRKERNTRRVSFKPSILQQAGGGGGGIRRRMAELAVRSHLEDDEDMGDFVASSSKSEHMRRKGSPIPKKKFSHTPLSKTPFGWYQISITNGHRYDKDILTRTLGNAIAPEQLVPLYWRTDRTYITFFVKEERVAQRLDNLERSVQMSDGFRPYVRVRPACPMVPVDDMLKDIMKQVMAKRYNAALKALDMSSFHTDPDFGNVFCGIFRTPVMLAAIAIMEKHIPDMVALNLSNNHISTMEAFRNAHIRLPNLRILHLADNRIPTIAHLIALRHVPFNELVLKNNALCSRYKDHTHYVSEIRRKFPKLKKLDGEELEPMIQFDVGDTVHMPTAKASFLCDANGADIIRQFLEQYFMIFDSNNRQPLLDAYHDQAMMSISVPPASQVGRLDGYWKYNRSLRRTNADEGVKIRQLKVGRLAVVSTLAELPATKHFPQSFSVDLTLFTPKMIAFTVAGMFKELTNNTDELRYFQRQYIVVPAGGGFCIRNEMIMITTVTHLQTRLFTKIISPAANAQTSGVASTATVSAGAPTNLQNRLQVTQPSTSTVTPLQPIGVDDATKMQMVQMLSSQSNMNLEWSKKCLEETNWDYNHAAFVFDKLHKESKIPPEAFVK